MSNIPVVRRASVMVFAAALLSGCASPDQRRVAAPRDPKTIFSPLHLPAPSALRTAAGLPGPDYWQQQADYEIQVSLDEEARRVAGQARVTYTNHSPDALDVLWLHLEQNLFRRDSHGALVHGEDGAFPVNDSQAGGLAIEAVRVNGADVRLQVFDTLGRIDLPQPLAPRGGQLTLDIAWSFRVPDNGAQRLGVEKVAQGLIFEIAQWFPAVCVYDDVHGWNTLPYLGQGEFYTNFGMYDVKITVPRSHIVVATGVLQNPQDVLTPAQIARLEQARGSRETVLIVRPEEVGTPESRPPGEGPLTWHFAAGDVRTFAWASSPAFIWDACGIAQRGRCPNEQPGDPRYPAGVLVQSAYPKEAIGQWSKSTDMLRFAIEGYNQRWFSYPYPSAINVNGIVGGMEYPMIVFCSERHDERGLYGVTTHEIAHNWFPMVVNTDERRYAWMDEGLDSFVNIYSMQERYPGDAPRRRGRGEPAHLKRFAWQPIYTPPDQNARSQLGMLQYSKTAVGLYALREGVLGAERFDRAFRRYIDAWAWKSPQPADFFRCMETYAGADLAWFWRGWFMETGSLDQALVDVALRDDRWIARIQNRGALVMPIECRVDYDDGTQRAVRAPVEVWFTSNEVVLDLGPAQPRVTQVALDPQEALPDVDARNNVWP